MDNTLTYLSRDASPRNNHESCNVTTVQESEKFDVHRMLQCQTVQPDEPLLDESLRNMTSS